MNQFSKYFNFIYHKDLNKADWFYGEVLGLKMEPESDGVHLFEVNDSVYIGVVQDGKGHLRAADDKPTILCLCVAPGADIREIYQRVKDAGITIQIELGYREIEGWLFFCEDPEGYCVEITQNEIPGQG